MSTVKISELPEITHLNTNTDETVLVGVDLLTSETGQITVTTLGEGLYAYQPLKVGENQVLFSNTIGQFSGNSNTFLQINNQNFNANGSSDYVASTSDSDNTNKYIDMGINGSRFNDSVYSSMKPYDGYLYAYGNTATSTSGNLVIGTASSFANIVYIVGGTTSSNIVARMSKTALEFSSGYGLKFGDGTTQITASNPAAYSSAAYAQANVTVGVDATQNTAISSTDGKMQSAYNKANTALANTTGTFAGDLTITGNLLTQGTVSLNNSSFNANSPFIKITASNNYTTVAPSNTNYMLQITGKANTVTRVVLDSFGQNSYPVLIGRMGRGSADAPAATQNNDVMMRIVGNGYTGTQFPPSSPTKIDFVAAENFSDTNRGTQIQFWNTVTGSNTIQRVATFNAESATFLGTVNPTKGFIYTPLVYPNAQTAITIDFANNSMVRAQTSTGLVVSMSNFTVGKIVELWITNLAGTNQTYTTGVSAINSTLNATTYTIPSTSTVCARYFCVDGTLANTLVSVIHA
jgi:hypothetical protein